MSGVIGKSLPRVEGAEKVSGALRYTGRSLSARYFVGQGVAQSLCSCAYPQYRYQPREKSVRCRGDRNRS